ncbi:MAG: HD domain-containing protein [Eggerthellaceae bacterium]|nr:HD domain-containing protein [Eggerthellaceae bacterium]
MPYGVGQQATLSLPEAACKVLDALERAGYEAWVVGGFVRDSLLGRAVNDVDIATNAHWQDVRSVARRAGMHTIETGVAHGTITVRCLGSSIEVTSFRSEGAYSDARHPDKVDFIESIEEDLSRRDFTANAIAYHPRRGLFDPFGGAEDIETGVIRAVGEPKKRFSEDALRIARAVRFASELGFSIERTTLAGAEENTGLLARVSVERIAKELTRMLCGSSVRSVIVGYPALIDALLPELAPMRGFDQRSPYHVYDVYEHTAFVVEGVDPKPLLRWAALLHDCGKPGSFSVGENGQGHFYGHAKLSAHIAQKLLSRLKMSKTFSANVVKLVRYHDVHRKPSKEGVKRMLAQLDENPNLFRDLCALQRSDAFAHAPGHTDRSALADAMEACLNEVMANGEAYRIADLAISGKDLMHAGFEQGPAIGELLDEALDAVICGRAENTSADLLAYLAKWKNLH